MKRDIIDAIDELVDEQLANYHNRSGYDHNINQDKCWHCGRDWHGLAITQKIASMAAMRRYDEDYRYADDDSVVLCPGSDFIGPIPATVSRSVTVEVGDGLGPVWRELAGDLIAGQRPSPPNASSPRWLTELIDATTQFYFDAIGLGALRIHTWLPGDNTDESTEPHYGLGLAGGSPVFDEPYFTPFDSNGQLDTNAIAAAGFQPIGYRTEGGIQ